MPLTVFRETQSVVQNKAHTRRNEGRDRNSRRSCSRVRPICDVTPRNSSTWPGHSLSGSRDALICGCEAKRPLHLATLAETVTAALPIGPLKLSLLHAGCKRAFQLFPLDPVDEPIEACRSFPPKTKCPLITLKRK